MTTMGDDERDAFLLEVRLCTLAVGRVAKGPLMAPIWYRFCPPGTFELCMGEDSAKARRLRAEGRATLAVVDEGRPGPYRYVTAEGPVTLTPLGDRTHDEILALSSRYLGDKGGARYTAQFMDRLSGDSLHPDHGTSEVMVRLDVEHWRTEVLG
jgi:nitroimidazol reductase NimA-like FMN-containing flavoprotein (pyridoxamine 5'-phosphate oxidase superfamily)